MSFLDSVLSEEGLAVVGHNKPLKFPNLSTLENWLSIERSAWNNFVQDVNERDTIDHHLRRIIESPYQILSNALNALSQINGANEKNRIRGISTFDTAFDHIANGHFPISTSAEAKRLFALAKSDPSAAAGALILSGLGEIMIAEYRGKEMDIAPFFRAIISGANAKSDLKNTSKAEREALADLRDGLSRENDIYLVERNKEFTAQTDKINDSFKQFVEQNTGEVKRIREAETKYNQWIGRAQKEVEDFRDLLVTKLATDDAVKLWETAAATHKTRGILAIIIFAVLAVAGALGIIFSFDIVLERLSKIGTSGANGSIGAPGGIAISVLLSFPILALAWAMRLLSRLYVQSLHATRDAEIRAALTKTFLNLGADTKNRIKDAERILILNALFRPPGATSDDDTLPPNLIEAITNARKGG